MRRVLLMVAVAAFLGGGVSAGAPGTDLGEVSHGGATYVTPGPNGFLDILYMTDEYSAGLLQNGTATAPASGWVSADDFVLDGDATIEYIVYWVINYQGVSGYYHRFWEDTGGSGPGSELPNAPGTFELTSTGEYSWGYLLYRADIDLDPDYDIDAGHYWGASYFSSGFWYMLVRTNAYDDQEYFDQGGGGSGPWYSSQYMWGTAYDFFQIIDGVGGWTPPVPYVDGMDPDDGDDEVPLDVDIVFHCKDDGHPIDTDTIVFTVEDQSRRPGRGAPVSDSALTAGRVNPRPTGEISGILSIDDADLFDVRCTFDPDADLPVDLITCIVDGSLANSKGWVMGDDFVWSFETEDSGPGVVQKTWGAIKAEF